MVFHGTYILSYTVNGEPKELVVTVNLKQIERLTHKYQNIWYGEAKVNDVLYNEVDLSHCVNALFAAEEIGEKLKNDLKKKIRDEGKRFKVKNEELK